MTMDFWSVVFGVTVGSALLAFGIIPTRIRAAVTRRREPQEFVDMGEQLAAIEHQRWADWQEYMHSLCTRNLDGSLTIPEESVRHWERQIRTPYSELSEREKESDREQVDRYWPKVIEFFRD